MWANILDRRRFAILAGAILAITVTVGRPAAVSAQTPAAVSAQTPAPQRPVDVFVAESVPVDVTAANVTDARERGLVQGRVTGLRRVLERIVSREDLARVPQLSSTQVIDMVRDFSIANERSSAVRYLADLTVRFDPQAVRTMLRRAGISFTETVSKPLVVLPLLKDAGDQHLVLWGDGNPWRNAWSRTSTDRGLVPMFLPAADAADAGAVTPEQAAARDSAALGAFAAHYDAGGVMVATATVGAGDVVQVTMAEVRPGLAPEEVSISQGAEAGQSRDDVLAAAVRSAVAAVEDNWRRRNRVTLGTIAQITALVPITDLKEWLAVKDRLAQVPLIDRLELQAMTRDRAQVTLYYAGEQSQLSLAMTQQDLSLSQQNGIWLIQVMRGGKAPGRTLGPPGSAAAGSAAQ